MIRIDTSGFGDKEAMAYVMAVIKQGRISNQGKEYCYVTGFENARVFAHRTTKGTDCFSLVRLVDGKEVYNGKEN